jgi:hypothetical protein
VSVYTISPKYHDSQFASADWLHPDQPTKLTSAVKPGATGKAIITLTAPSKPGSYTEYFSLAAENTTWIQGATFYFKIIVTPPSKTAPSVPVIIPTSTPDTLSAARPALSTSTDSAPSSKGVLAAALSDLSTENVDAPGGTQIAVSLKYTNTGTSAWSGVEWREALSRPLTTSTVGLPINLADTSWQTGNIIFSNDTVVNPGMEVPLQFIFRTPEKTGKYLARFALRSEGQVIPGAVLEIPIIVNQDVPDNYSPAVFSPSRTLLSSPTIRVGLYSPTAAVMVKGSSDYALYSGETLQGTLSEGAVAKLSYKDGEYAFTIGEITGTASEPLRLVPQDLASTFTITNYDRRATGRKDTFNTYRGILELTYSAKSKMLYVVNELPLDAYIAGVAETSNDAPVEYLLAQAVAERSYAYYKLTYARATNKTVYDVVPTTADQLYLGYTSESASPNVAMGAYATAGQLVTYQGVPVVTPYFTRTDGRTRSWTEVWGGPAKPWLVSVAAKYDAGKTMSGHGVGMSGADASRRAALDGWKYDQILRYYYSGTEVEKVY